jgi:hypothetical protein
VATSPCLERALDARRCAVGFDTPGWPHCDAQRSHAREVEKSTVSVIFNLLGLVDKGGSPRSVAVELIEIVSDAGQPFSLQPPAYPSGQVAGRRTSPVRADRSRDVISRTRSRTTRSTSRRSRASRPIGLPLHSLVMPKLRPEVLREVELAFESYEREVESAALQNATKRTYLLHAGNFVRRLRDDFSPGERVADQRH